LTERSVYASIDGVPTPSHPLRGGLGGSSPRVSTADAVVVGGGTIGAWCAYFLREAGLNRVILLEKRTLGQGASSRAAGIVRTQGGTRWAVQLGEWSRTFYLSQRDRLGIDSGFRPQGYVLPCFTEEDVHAARARMAMQNSLGLAVRWLEPDELDRLNPTLTPGITRGGTYCAEDGYLNPPRNVTAYAVALAVSGVEVREHTEFTGLVRVEGGRAGQGGKVTGVETSRGRIDSPLVVLTGGPELAEVGALAGIRIPAGGVRHQVAVTQPHPDLDPSRLPMVFDLSAGLYWRPEEKGLLFGMSNPDERPGPAASVDDAYLALMRKRLGELVPVTRGLGLRRIWAATIDYTPDHLPIIGPALSREQILHGVTVAAAGGAGMMWGPAVARAAADVAATGRSDVVDTTALGLDRFDEEGNSRLATDPIALPFPAGAPQAPGKLTV
jgi:sarcosine oxidase, subunit beta